MGCLVLDLQRTAEGIAHSVVFGRRPFPAASTYRRRSPTKGPFELGCIYHAVILAGQAFVVSVEWCVRVGNVFVKH